MTEKKSLYDTDGLEFCDRDAADFFRQHHVAEVFEFSENLDRQIDMNRAYLNEIVQTGCGDVLKIHSLLEKLDDTANEICLTINSFEKHSFKLPDEIRKLPQISESIIFRNDSLTSANENDSIDLLLAAPENIWQLLDKNHYLQAVHHLYHSRNQLKNVKKIEFLEQKLNYLETKIVKDLVVKFKMDNWIVESNLLNYLLAYTKISQITDRAHFINQIIDLRKLSISNLFDLPQTFKSLSTIIENILTTFQLVFHGVHIFEKDYQTIEDYYRNVTFNSKNLKLNESELNAINAYFENLKSQFESKLIDYLETITKIQDLSEMYENYRQSEKLENWSEILQLFLLPATFSIWLEYLGGPVSNYTKKVTEKVVFECFESIKTRILNLDRRQNSEIDIRDLFWNDFVDSSIDQLKIRLRGYSSSIVELDSIVDCVAGEIHDELVRSKGFLQNSEEFLKIICSNAILNFQREMLHLSDNNLEVILLSLRFFESLTSQCPNLKKCFSLFDIDWQQFTYTLLKENETFWLRWAEIVSDTKMRIFICEQFAQMKPKKSYFTWKTIEIDEESNNETSKSKIRIPNEPSHQIYRIFLESSVELSKVLPHKIPQIVRIRFVEMIFAAIFTEYEKFLSFDNNNENSSTPALHQNNYLQYFFDLKYLTNYCFISKQLMDRVRLLADRFQSKIDPFDFKVFYPFLKSHSNTAFDRTKELYGCLLIENQSS